MHCLELRLPFSIPHLNLLRFFLKKNFGFVINVRDMVIYEIPVVPQTPAAGNAQALTLLVIVTVKRGSLLILVELTNLVFALVLPKLWPW